MGCVGHGLGAAVHLHPNGLSVPGLGSGSSKEQDLPWGMLCEHVLLSLHLQGSLQPGAAA